MSSDILSSTQLTLPHLTLLYVTWKWFSRGFFCWLYQYMYEICQNIEIFKLAPYLDFCLWFAFWNLKYHFSHTHWTIHQNHANRNTSRIPVYSEQYIYTFIGRLFGGERKEVRPGEKATYSVWLCAAYLQ